MQSIDIDKLSTFNAIYEFELTDDQIKEILEKFKTFSEKAAKFITDTDQRYWDPKTYIHVTQYRLANTAMPLLLFMARAGNKAFVSLAGEREIISGATAGSFYFSDIQSIVFNYEDEVLEHRALAQKLEDLYSAMGTPSHTRGYMVLKSKDDFDATYRQKIAAHPFGGYVNRISRFLNDANVKTFNLIFDAYGWPIRLDAEKYNRISDETVNNVSTITEVFDLPNNHRLAVVESYVNYRESYARTARYKMYTWYIIQSTEQLYNFTDVGRKLVFEERYYSLAEQGAQVRLPELVFVGEEPCFPEDTQILFKVKDLPAYRGQRTCFLSDEQLKRGLSSLAIEEKRANITKTREKAQVTALTTQLSKLTNTAGLKINDVTFYSDRFEYDGLKFQTDAITTKEMVEALSRHVGLQNITYETATAQMYAWIERKRPTNGVTVISHNTIGSINVNVEFRCATNTKNVNTTRLYINGKTINLSELREVLEHATCFTNQANFDGFLNKVSKCSLKMHRWLAEGFKCVIRNEFGGTPFHVKLELQRVKNKNFLKVGNDSYPLAKIQKLMKEGGRYHDRYSYGGTYNFTLDGFLNTLMDDDILGIKDQAVLIDILNKGKQSYKQAIAKSIKLLESAEKTLKIKEENHKLGNTGEMVKGYLIEGISGTKYIVGSDDGATDPYHKKPYPVYDFESGRAICIIDRNDSVVNQVGKDALVNRLFALKNDKLVANKIHTLKV